VRVLTDIRMTEVGVAIFSLTLKDKQSILEQIRNKKLSFRRTHIV